MQNKIHHVHIPSIISYLLFIYGRKIQKNQIRKFFYEIIEEAKKSLIWNLVFPGIFLFTIPFLLIILILNCLRDFLNIVYIEWKTLFFILKFFASHNNFLVKKSLF